MLVANHTNGLVDGLLLMAALRRYPRFLGKSTLFKIPPLWPFLKLAGVIPVYRSIDAVTGDHNVSAFATSHTLLRDGGMVAVFPEGISHDEVTLQPLKTGAARIALEAADDGGAEDLVTVAVGLVYDAKARFRSRALVRVGQPVKVAQWAEAYRRDERATVRAVTEDLAVQLDASIPRSPRGRKPRSSRGSPSWSSAVPARTRRVIPGWPTGSTWRRVWRRTRTRAPNRCSSCSRTSRPTSGISSCSV